MAITSAVPSWLKLSPWIWDNVKFLFYWYVAAAPLAAGALAWVSRRGRLGPPAAALLLLAATAAGALDAWRYASRSRLHVLFDRDAVAIADAIARAVPPRALVLHYPTFNAPPLLSFEIGHDRRLHDGEAGEKRFLRQPDTFYQQAA